MTPENFSAYPPPSGESGSGKTEAFKHIVRHLTARSSPKGFALEPRMKHVSQRNHHLCASACTCLTFSPEAVAYYKGITDKLTAVVGFFSVRENL